MPALSKTAQVFKFFAQQYGHPGLPRKRLAKLTYTSDVLARQYLGRPITDLEYIKDHYGPYARALPDYVQELTSAELAEETTHRDGEHRTIRLRDLGRPIAFDFSLGENEILGYVATNYLNMDLDEFIDHVVKETDPFKATGVQGERLPMDIVNGSAADESGFDLEAVIRAERQAEEGQYLTLAEFADGLRAEITARHPE
jgi:uncharacterized protein YwgA